MKVFRGQQKKAFDKGLAEGINHTVEQVVAISVIVLNDKFGFSQAEQEKFAEHFMMYMAQLEEGNVSGKDILELFKKLLTN